MNVVKAYVEPRFRFARYDVLRRVANVDAGDLETRVLKMFITLVERLRC